MNPIRLAVMGAGSVRCALPMIGSLATYFGERPLEIAFWDADEERLDLFDRFARLCFIMTNSTHSLRSTTVWEEAMEDADLAILQWGSHCARLAGNSTLDRILEEVEKRNLFALSLQPAGPQITSNSSQTDRWPKRLNDTERLVIPHQVLRYLNGEEYPHDVLKQYARSPIKEWLDDPIGLMRQPGLLLHDELNRHEDKKARENPPQ